MGEIVTSDECIYIIQHVERARFECAGSSYEISFSKHTEKMGEAYDKLFEKYLNANKDKPVLSFDNAIKKKIGKYTHYYFAISTADMDLLLLSESNFKPYHYSICSNETCVNLATIQRKIIYTVYKQLKIGLIKSDDL